MKESESGLDGYLGAEAQWEEREFGIVDTGKKEWKERLGKDRLLEAWVSLMFPF